MIAILALLACTRAEPGFTVLASDLPAGLTSIWSPGDGEVWIVGGDATVLHLADGAWERLSPPGAGDLWWVWGDGEAVWMVGDGGRVLRYDGAFTEVVVAPELTLFGVWGTGPSDVWAVGGDLALGADGAALWHGGVQGFTRQELPEAAAAASALYKIWGDGSRIWAVGTGGVTLVDEGAGWVVAPAPVPRNLFTTHGGYAVGGAASGTILRWEGGGWVDETPPLAPQINGVFTREGCDPVGVGIQGAVLRRSDGVWTADPRPSPTRLDLHGVHLDTTCDVWVVGGALSSLPLSDGVVLYGGDAEIPEVP